MLKTSTSEDGYLVTGVDEAGRGPLAGPVVAAAVILRPDCRLEGLDDSKRLTRKQRDHLDPLIKRAALCWAIGAATVREIDAMNILQASLLAMSRAVAALTARPNLVLVDGCHAPNLNCEVQAIVKGDQKIASISAASILAKVHRDQIMIDYHCQYPQYGFATNMGYPTPAHIRALRLHGVTKTHRRSFAPVRAAIRDAEQIP